jgi:diacylglycerol kinase (ATP)
VDSKPRTGSGLLWSFNFAIEGVVYALRTQRNMRIHMAAAIVTLIAALALNVDRMGLVAVVFAISLVFVTELANTAIEATVDVAIQGYDPLAKIAKDVAAGAVLIAATNAIVVAYLVMFEALRRVASQGLNIVEVAPVDITVVALALTLLIVLIFKAIAREGTFMHGGWPSGHTALAFGAATALALVTQNGAAAILAYLVAALVAQSRVEGEIHSVPQVVLGAVVGILVVVAVFQLFFRP